MNDPHMEEDIEALLCTEKLDRKAIEEINRRSLSTKKFSYVPYLVKVCYEMPDLSLYPTLSILRFLNKLFRTPQHFQEKIEEVGLHLRTRSDLFQAFLMFSKNKRFKDDMHYWHPDLRHTSIFSFICDLFDDVSALFVFHATRSLITDQEIHPELVEMMENKLSVSALAQLSIMKKDIEVFEDECRLGIPKHNLPVTKKETKLYRTVISHSYWSSAACESFAFFEIEHPSHKDRRYVPCGCFSMIEIDFVGSRRVTLLVTLKAFEGLLLKEESTKSYWVELGIVNANWDFVV